MRITLVSLALLIAPAVSCSTEAVYQVRSTEEARLSRSAAQAVHAEIEPQVPTTLKLSLPPRILSSRFPDYPQNFRNAGIEGNVVVQFYVEPDGTVSNPTVLGSPPAELAAITLHAIMQWKFAAAVKDGIPTRSQVQQTFQFKLE